MVFLSVLIALVTTAVIAYYYYYKRRLSFFKEHGILHLPLVPFFGNMAGLVCKQYTLQELIQKAYDLHTDAKYVVLYEFHRPIIVIRDPELIKTICVKNFDNFQDHRNLVLKETDPLLGNVLFNQPGKQWKEERAMLSPTFTSSKMKSMFVLMSECAARFTNAVTEIPEKGQDLEMKGLLSKYTNDVIASCVYGISVDSVKDPNNIFYVNGRKSTTLTGFKNSIKMLIQRNFPTVACALRLHILETRLSKFFENQIQDTMKMREESGIHRSDMIQILMDLRKDLSMFQIASHAFGFYFGGLESTATQASLMAHLLLENPDVHDRLQQTIDDTLEQNNGQLTYEAVNDMKYLDAVINETMRLYPIIPFLDRTCTKPFELPPDLPGGKPFTLQPGISAWIPVISIQTDPKYYDNPEKFDPDRFMDNGKKILNSQYYIPFGFGPRVCIGNRFALLNMKVMFCYLLARCNIKVGANTTVPLEFEKGIFGVAAKNGFRVKVEPRKNPPEIHSLINGNGIRTESTD